MVYGNLTVPKGKKGNDFVAVVITLRTDENEVSLLTKGKVIDITAVDMLVLDTAILDNNGVTVTNCVLVMDTRYTLTGRVILIADNNKEGIVVLDGVTWFRVVTTDKVVKDVAHKGHDFYIKTSFKKRKRC